MCHINYYICSRCYHGYARFTNICPDMHPPCRFCPKGTPFHIRVVDETLCYLHPYHVAPMYEGYMPYSSSSIVIPTPSHDAQSRASMDRQHSPRLEKATEASSTSTATITPPSYRSRVEDVNPGQERGDTSGCSVEQYPNQTNQPANNNPTVYGLGSQNYAFYPYQNSPMHPFYYPQPGTITTCSPFQTPPPPQQSQLASPSSHHTQESGWQTPFNPQAQAFQSRKSSDELQGDQRPESVEDIETGNKETLYNSQRGISRSLCNDDEYQSDLDINAMSTPVRKNTQPVGPAMHVSSVKSDSSLLSRSSIQSRQPLGVEQTDCTGNLHREIPVSPSPKTSSPSGPLAPPSSPCEDDGTTSDAKAAVAECTPLSDLLADKTGLEFNNQLEFADKCKIDFSMASSKGVYHKPQDPTRGRHGFAVLEDNEPAVHRSLWSDEVADALAEGDTTIKVESDDEAKPDTTTIKAMSIDSGLSDLAIKSESDEEELRPSDVANIPTKTEPSDEDTKPRDVPHAQDSRDLAATAPSKGPEAPRPRQGATAATTPAPKEHQHHKKPQPADPERKETAKRIFDDADFPALGAAAKKNAAAAADTPVSPLAAVSFRNPWTSEPAPAPVSWSSVVSGKRAQAAPAPASPVPSLGSRSDNNNNNNGGISKETPSPRTTVASDAVDNNKSHSKKEEAGEREVDLAGDKPTPTPSPASKPSKPSASASASSAAESPGELKSMSMSMSVPSRREDSTEGDASTPTPTPTPTPAPALKPTTTTTTTTTTEEQEEEVEQEAKAEKGEESKDPPSSEPAQPPPPPPSPPRPRLWSQLVGGSGSRSSALPPLPPRRRPPSPSLPAPLVPSTSTSTSTSTAEVWSKSTATKDDGGNGNGKDDDDRTWPSLGAARTTNTGGGGVGIGGWGKLMKKKRRGA